MGISRIKIRNYRSLKNVDYDISKGNINCLIGKNGVGKTSLEDAISYFYNVAGNPYVVKNVIDKRNPYVQKATIELTFDFALLEETREHNQYVDADIKEFEPFIISKKLNIKMTQYKNGIIEWSPINDRYKVVKLLKIFPVYMIRTKSIDSESWNTIWDVVSDIAITGLKTSDEFPTRLQGIFEELYGNKYQKALNAFKNVLEKERININEEEYKKRFKYALITNLGGNDFEFDEERLDFYSDGINSKKYISFLVSLVSELVALSWKDVLLIFDEPEISLHPQYIEELSEIISNATNRINFIIATHSTKLISSLLKNNPDQTISFNQVVMKNGYTFIAPIREIFSDKDRYLICEEQAESYFSTGMLFVEGQTEVHVFKNRRIVRLFPFLKKVTVYNTKSNDSTTRLLCPKNYRKPVIPFLILVDMDKILASTGKEISFCLKSKAGTVNPFANKGFKDSERYLYYGMRKVNTKYKRESINRLIKQIKGVDLDDCYNKNVLYSKLINQIQEYCTEYGVSVLKTTIEGTIICDESINYVMEWIREKGLNTVGLKNPDGDYLEDLGPFSHKEKVAITRMVFLGKTDYLQDAVNRTDVKSIVDKYQRKRKVDGWVLDFFEWFFSAYVDEEENEEAKQKVFAKTFPELFKVVNQIECMLEYAK